MKAEELTTSPLLAICTCIDKQIQCRVDLCYLLLDLITLSIRGAVLKLPEQPLFSREKNLCSCHEFMAPSRKGLSREEDVSANLRKPLSKLLFRFDSCGSILGKNVSPNFLCFPCQPQTSQASHVFADGNRTNSNFLKSFRAFLSRKTLPFQSSDLFRRRGFGHYPSFYTCYIWAFPTKLRIRSEHHGLAEVERHMVQGETHLAKQLTLIAELERHGHDTRGAHAVLTTMRETQALHQQDRERILRKLHE
jgi:hypothetical protein